MSVTTCCSATPLLTPAIAATTTTTTTTSTSSSSSSYAISPCLISRSCNSYGSAIARKIVTQRFFSSSSSSRGFQIECCSGEGREDIGGKAGTPPRRDAEPSLLVKLAWYASEGFGNAVAALRLKGVAARGEEQHEECADGAVPREVAVQAIRRDFETSYFVTGDMSTNIYEHDCEFADPFVSFKGLKRFKKNVSNLGSFMEESNLKVLDWQENENKIYARWRFNCVLALPWRPILAATGSTEYYFNELSGKIYRHVETWDISPADGLRQLIKPNPKLRKTQKTP